MQCKCGKELTESSHTVTTDKGKLSWIEYAPEGDVDIHKWECSSCGRIFYKVWQGNKCLKTFG